MAEQLRFDRIGTGTELTWCSESGVSSVVVVEKSSRNVKVQYKDQPTRWLWLTEKQIECECMTAEEMAAPDESLLTDEEKQELKEIMDDPEPDFEDDADWWKKGGTK
jgi:hypothetical protein